MDFFFSYASTYTYLSVMRIQELAAKANVAILWRPFHLRTIAIEQNNRPFTGKPVKLKYMWRDLERRAAQHGIPFKGIPPYPVDPEGLAHRIGIIAAMEGWCPEYTVAIYRKWFLDNIEPGNPAQIGELLESLGKDSASVTARADSDEIRRHLVAETDVARSLGIFGSPTFAVDQEIFWGDDRLETALDWSRSTNR